MRVRPRRDGDLAPLGDERLAVAGIQPVGVDAGMGGGRREHPLTRDLLVTHDLREDGLADAECAGRLALLALEEDADDLPDAVIGRRTIVQFDRPSRPYVHRLD